ncbi:hypothetical protein GGR57DRAFT_65443 [Xylariaceae sp. FL1272]|nr:hypothetical protein GGR57DRAFT_65443 [Xylariaceae sp. FL1272]
MKAARAENACQLPAVQASVSMSVAALGLQTRLLTASHTTFLGASSPSRDLRRFSTCCDINSQVLVAWPRVAFGVFFSSYLNIPIGSYKYRELSSEGCYPDDTISTISTISGRLPLHTRRTSVGDLNYHLPSAARGTGVPQGADPTLGPTSTVGRPTSGCHCDLGA